MLDDFREWLSDNLRYILLGLAIILIVIILFCIVRLVSSGGRKESQPGGQTATNTQTTTVEDVTESGAASGNQAPSTDSSSLTRNDSAILTLVEKYYNAVADKDVATLSQIVSPWNDTVQASILGNDIIEKYNNITTYSKQGLDAGSYVVYVYFEGKVAGYDTLVPSLGRLYVVTGEGGSLVISYGSDLDSEVADYINTVSADADVRALREDVDRQYKAALASDEELAAFIATLDTGSSGDDDESVEDETEAEPVSSEPVQMKAIAGLNIRQSPSTDAAIVGSVINGTNVTVLEDAGDGWVHINYDSMGTILDGYVRLEYLTETDAAA